MLHSKTVDQRSHNDLQAGLEYDDTGRSNDSMDSNKLVVLESKLESAEDDQTATILKNKVKENQHTTAKKKNTETKQILSSLQKRRAIKDQATKLEKPGVESYVQTITKGLPLIGITSPKSVP